MNDTDFRQLNGAFDSAMDPDPAFVARLQKRMAQESPVQTSATQSPVRASMPARRDQLPASPTRSHPLFIAATVLVVFALAFASIVQLAPRVLDPQYASQAQATLPANASSTPGPDVTLAPATLPGIGRVSYFQATDESLVAVTWELDSEEQQLVSYNFTSGNVAWETDVSGIDHFLFGDGVVVGISYTFPDSQSENAMHRFDAMVAWDRDTGEELWRTSIARFEVVHGWETFDIAGDTVIFIGAGGLSAFSVTTGESRWDARYDLNVAREENYVQPPATSVLDDRLYVAQLDGSVVVYDVETGREWTRFNLPASFAAMHPVGLQLYQVPAGLLVVADRYGDPGPLTVLMVVNPGDGTLVWERSLRSTGLVSIAPDGSIAFAMHEWKNPPLLLRLLQQNGHSTAALMWLDANGNTILETEQVRIADDAPLVIAGNGNYACITAEEFVCFDRSGTKYVSGKESVWGALFLGNMLVLFTDTGVAGEEMP